MSIISESDELRRQEVEDLRFRLSKAEEERDRALVENAALYEQVEVLRLTLRVIRTDAAYALDKVDG